MKNKFIILIVVLFSGLSLGFNLLAYEKIEDNYILYSLYQSNDNEFGTDFDNSFDSEKMNELLSSYVDYYDMNDLFVDSAYNVPYYEIYVEGIFDVVTYFEGSLKFYFPKVLNSNLIDYTVFDLVYFEDYYFIGNMSVYYNDGAYYSLSFTPQGIINEVNHNLSEGLYTFITINLEPGVPVVPKEPLSIFGFFRYFYEEFIFPNNILDGQVMDFIAAGTTLLFFIALFKGIWSIFSRRKRK